MKLHNCQLCALLRVEEQGHRTTVYSKLVADPEGFVGFCMKKPRSNPLPC